MAERLENDYVVIRHPDSDGEIIHKMAGRQLVASDLKNHDGLIFQSVPDVSSLSEKQVNRSGIDADSDLAELLAEHLGIRVGES